MQASATRSPIPSRLATGVPWTRLWGICYWKSKSAQEHFLWHTTSYNYMYIYKTIYIYVTQEWEAFVDLPTFIQYLFRLDKQRNIFEKCCTYTSNVNVWCKRTIWIFEIVLFFLIIYLRPTSFFYFRLISSSLKKLIIVLIFTKIYQIHQKILKIKDGRIPNKIIK